MQRWTRGALSGAAVIGLAVGLLAIGTATGAPPDQPERPDRPAAARVGGSVADLQRELTRLPGAWPT